MDYTAIQEYPDAEVVLPGEGVRALMTLIEPSLHIGKLVPGTEFVLREGFHVIARGVVTRVFAPLEISAP